MSIMDIYKKGYARKRVPHYINWVKYYVKQYESYGMLTFFYCVSLLLTLIPFCHSDTYEEADLHLQDHFMSSDLEDMESESLAKSNRPAIERPRNPKDVF